MVSNNSLLTLRNNLKKIRSRGGSSHTMFLKSMKHMARNIRWRKNAAKVIVIISNSSVNRARFCEQYAIGARQKGIAVFALGLGKLKTKETKMLKRLSHIAGGNYYSATYHQKLFDRDAKPIELFMEKRRLFTAPGRTDSWVQGLFAQSGTYSMYGRVKDSYDEIPFNETKVFITPYNMASKYQIIKLTPIISKRPLENNINRILTNIGNRFLKKNKTTQSTFGKVLFTDGTVTIWNFIKSKKHFNYFKRKKNYPYYFPIGIEIRKDTGKTYGIRVIPRVINITSDFIPAMVKTDLSAIIKNSNYYMNNGLLNPPVWFVNVKVAKLVITRDKKDIRGN